MKNKHSIQVQAIYIYIDVTGAILLLIHVYHYSLDTMYEDWHKSTFCMCSLCSMTIMYMCTRTVWSKLTISGDLHMCFTLCLKLMAAAQAYKIFFLNNININNIKIKWVQYFTSDTTHLQNYLLNMKTKTTTDNNFSLWIILNNPV